ncbi:hypothetical protein Btru_064811 [Bulinus truncatus]|nr:hypothetical protein Btru_064811 [Bulinus truncatus]
MALKDTIETWNQACCMLDEMKLPDAVLRLQAIENPTAKIVHNVGCILMLQNLFPEAVKSFQSSIEKDKHFALSYFILGLCQHQLHKYSESLASFKESRSHIKGPEINYKQLGAPMVLTGHLVDQCIAISKDCISKKKHVLLPDVSILDCVFRPPKSMVDNLVKKDFLGKAKIVSSNEPKDSLSAGHYSDIQPSGTCQTKTSPMTTKDFRSIPCPPNRPPPRPPRTDLTQNEKAMPHSFHVHSQMSSHARGSELDTVIPAAYSVPTSHQLVGLTTQGYSVPNQHLTLTGSASVPLKKAPEVSPYLVTDLSKLLLDTIHSKPTVSVQRSKSAVTVPMKFVDQKTRADSKSLRQPANKPARPPPPSRGLNT